jgi:oligoribonuclease (3'-5' exoribonuclease)
MGNASQKGYFGKVLAMDCETSGININGYDPSVGYQAVSWGLAVADADTLKVIDTLYVEIKWNGVAKWEKKAEAVHGLSIDHLKRSGMTEEQAIEEIANFIYKYWPPDDEFSSKRSVRCLGHNVATFDVWFLRQLFDKFELPLRTGNRFIDSSSIAYATLGAYTSDEAFEMIGIQRMGTHNALDDALYSLALVRRIKSLYDNIIAS